MEHKLISQLSGSGLDEAKCRCGAWSVRNARLHTIDKMYAEHVKAPSSTYCSNYERKLRKL